MTIRDWCSRVIYGTLVATTVLSLLWVLFLLAMSFGEWASISYVVFVIWSSTLVAWSYRKLNDEIILVQDVSNEADSSAGWHRFEDREYNAMGMRHFFYFIALASMWSVLFMGVPETNDFGDLRCNSVMEQLALKHFGYRDTFEGFTQFRYISSIYQVVFHVLSVIPLLILTIGGYTIYKMASKRLLEVKARAEHVSESEDDSTK